MTTFNKGGYTDTKALRSSKAFLSLCTYHRLHNVLRAFIMRKMSITAFITYFGRNNEKVNWKVRLHLCFQTSGLNFSSYRKRLNQFIINISKPLNFAAFR